MYTPACQLHCHASLGKTCRDRLCICQTKVVLAILLACVSVSPLLLIVYITYHLCDPQCRLAMHKCFWSSRTHVGCRKVKALMDDAEVIIPLKGYNPETRTKISSQVTTTARSTAGHTPRYQGSAAPNHMQGPCVFTADATGHDPHAAQPSMV